MNSLSFKLFSCALVALIASACSSTDAPQQDSDEVINIEASQLVVTLNGADVQATSATLNLADNTIVCIFENFRICIAVDGNNG